MKESERARAIMRAKELKQSSWFKLVADELNTFRILPTPESKTTPANWYEYRVHRDVGPEKKKIRCGLDIKERGHCWICDQLIPRLMDKGRERTAQALQASVEFITQVASVDQDTGQMIGPLVWSPSKKVYNQLLSKIFPAEKHDYVDPKEGHNLSLYRTGSGFKDTTYGDVRPDADPTPVPKDIIKRLKPFSELKEIPVYSEATQKAAYQGIDLKEEGEKNMPKEDKKHVLAKKKVVEDDEDDEDEVEDTDDDESEDEDPGDDEEEPEDEDETEEEVEEEDEEPEEEDDDEEEEPPVKKKKSVVKAAAPPVKKKKVVVEEDDGDEEPEEDDDDDEEEEPTPKKAVKKPIKASAPVEEDDEDDDDEEEEEEPVVVKKHLVKRKK